MDNAQEYTVELSGTVCVCGHDIITHSFLNDACDDCDCLQFTPKVVIEQEFEIEGENDNV